MATLIHELAHALVYLSRGEGEEREYSYAEEELIVESVVFCCCRSVGLDTSANSIPYLASWAENANLDVLAACGAADRADRRPDRHHARWEQGGGGGVADGVNPRGWGRRLDPGGG